MAVDDDALEAVDEEVATDALETLDDELEDSSAAKRLVRSASSSDSTLLALDELSVEVEETEEVELLETPGGGPPGGGPPTPSGPPDEALLAALWLPSDPTPPSCDRKASTAADTPTAADASEVETALLAEVEVDALVVEASDEPP